MFLFLLRLNRPRKSGRGVDKSYLLDDSVAFGLPLFYNQRLPDHKSGMITVQKHRNIFLTMLSHRTDMGLSQPRTQSLGFTDIIAQRVRKCKNFIIFQNQTFELAGIIRKQNKTRLYWRVCLSWLGYTVP